MNKTFSGRDPYDDVQRLYQERQSELDKIYDYYDRKQNADMPTIDSPEYMDRFYNKEKKFERDVSQEEYYADHLDWLRNQPKIKTMRSRANARSFQPAVGEVFTLECNHTKRFVPVVWNGKKNDEARCKKCVFHKPLWASGGDECLTTNCGTFLRERRDGNQVYITEIDNENEI